MRPELLVAFSNHDYLGCTGVDRELFGRLFELVCAFTSSHNNRYHVLKRRYVMTLYCHPFPSVNDICLYMSDSTCLSFFVAAGTVGIMIVRGLW